MDKKKNTKVVRALKTSLDASDGGYGKVYENDVIELEAKLAKELVDDGQFEWVDVPEGSYVTKMDEPTDDKVIEADTSSSKRKSSEKEDIRTVTSTAPLTKESKSDTKSS